MSDYKKKSVKRKPIRQERKVYPMRSSNYKRASSIEEKPRFRVREGKKNDLHLSLFIAASLLIVIAAIYLIILAFHPIGVGEFFSSKFKSGGKDKNFTSALSGENIVSVCEQDNYFYTLTDTHVYCTNNNGKKISLIDHGFARPVLYSSETRYIIFGQGEQTVKVYNFEKELHNLHFETKVLAAAISDNGNFAIATTADGYDSAVTVYNKNGKVLYEWYSSSGIVSTISFNQNGKKLLISTFSAQNGEFLSKILVLNFKSADPENIFKFDEELCYNTHFITNDRVSAVFENSVKFLDLKDNSVTTKSFEYSVKIAKQIDNYVLISGNLDSNTDKNHITLYNKKTECLADFSVDSNVKDVIYKGKRIYILGDSSLNCYDLNGKLLYFAPVTYDVKSIVHIDDKHLVVISKNIISKLELENVEW